MIVITTLGWKVVVNYCPRIWIPCLYFLQKNNFFSIDLALICISQSIVGVGSKFSFTSSIFIFLNYYWEISQLSACTAIRHCFIYTFIWALESFLQNQFNCMSFGIFADIQHSDSAKFLSVLFLSNQNLKCCLKIKLGIILWSIRHASNSQPMTWKILMNGFDSNHNRIPPLNMFNTQNIAPDNCLYRMCLLLGWCATG